MAREIPESEVATMEALVKCAVSMVSIALAYAAPRRCESSQLFWRSLTLQARIGRVDE